MKLYLERTDFTDKSTIGSLYREILNPDKSTSMEFICYILEDKCRQEFGQPFTKEMKVYGETAIPYGTYEVIINYSPAFKKDLPLLLNVPFYEGVRAHTGNHSGNSSGCLICGTSKSKDWVSDSKTAFNKLFSLLKETLKTEKVYIEIGRNEK